MEPMNTNLEEILRVVGLIANRDTDEAGSPYVSLASDREDARYIMKLLRAELAGQRTPHVPWMAPPVPCGMSDGPIPGPLFRNPGMNPEFIPESIGGYQHLEPEVVVRADDILVDGGAPFRFAGCALADRPASFAEKLMECRVYRKMPVAHQHDPL